MIPLFLLVGCNLSYIVDLFAALHEFASASARTLLKLASSVSARLKPYWATLTAIFFAAVTIRRCLTATAKLASREFSGLLLFRALGDPMLVFQWSAAWLSWPPLWWGVKGFQKFRRLKLGLSFCVDFLASSELIGYCRFDGFLWNLAKMFLGYQSAKMCEAFLIFPNTSSVTRSHVTKIGKYLIRHLKNRFSRQPIGISKKPHSLL